MIDIINDISQPLLLLSVYILFRQYLKSRIKEINKLVEDNPSKEKV